MSAQHTKNILRAYRAASDEDHAEGMAWYNEANAFAASLDSDVARAAAVISILSPLTSWPQNKERARRAYAGVRTGIGFPANCVKVARILDDGEPWQDVLRGPKVEAFFANIMGDPNHVTIDRHAIDIAIGKTLNNMERSPFLKGRKRAEIAASYLSAARILGVLPYEVQAVTWVWWRKNRAVAFHG